jgi:hypothetical protein
LEDDPPEQFPLMERQVELSSHMVIASKCSSWVLTAIRLIRTGW